jgi:DNA-binding GntR family transcriptional regulator
MAKGCQTRPAPGLTPGVLNSEFRMLRSLQSKCPERQVAVVRQLEVQPALIDQVHDRLLAAIADGTLASGQRLTQEGVATMLGVSRQPVSHALQVLKRRGLLVEHGKRGLQVAPIDGRRIRDLYLVREALDGLAARLAAQRVQGGEAAEAERRAAQWALAAGRRLGPRSPIARLIDADVAFHSAIHALSGNQAIVETVADQWLHFRRSMGLVLSVSGAYARYWDEHAAILDAVLVGDAPTAESRARCHTARAGEETALRLEATTQPNMPSNGARP